MIHRVFQPRHTCRGGASWAWGCSTVCHAGSRTTCWPPQPPTSPASVVRYSLCFPCSSSHRNGSQSRRSQCHDTGGPRSLESAWENFHVFSQNTSFWVSVWGRSSVAVLTDAGVISSSHGLSVLTDVIVSSSLLDEIAQVRLDRTKCATSRCKPDHQYERTTLADVHSIPGWFVNTLSP